MDSASRVMRHMAVLALALLVAGCTAAGPADPSTPPGAPTAELEAFGRHATEQGAPAVVIHVRNGGQEALKAIGVRDLESREPAEPADKLWISGAGAPMVAVSVMKLVEDGTVGLDVPVSEYLPEFAAIFPAWQESTIRQLLGSRTALPDYIPLLLQSRQVEELQTGGLTFEQRLKIASGVPGTPGPHSQLMWSATDWEVLAWLLERVHGRALAEVLTSDVFEPAGMSDTLVAAPGPPPEPMLHGYVLAGDRRLDFTRADVVAGSGDAGIISTVADVSSFFSALTAGRLLSPGTWESMIAGNPYDLGGFQWTDGICSANRHVFVYGGGGPYNIQSFSTLDGQQQITVGMALPPAELDITVTSPLITDLEEAIRSTAKSMCT